MSPAEDFNAKNIAEFRANGGKVGGSFEGAPVLLIHSVGARSGQPRVHPVMYLADGDRYLIFASKGGAPTNPSWYHNLMAHPDATIEVGTDALEVTAVPLMGKERDDFYERQSAVYPNFAEYQAKTSRTIPVVALTPKSTA
jgi:deazaflavin-dependent oxidoreductase (nitroreductase family)